MNNFVHFDLFFFHNKPCFISKTPCSKTLREEIAKLKTEPMPKPNRPYQSDKDTNGQQPPQSPSNSPPIRIIRRDQKDKQPLAMRLVPPPQTPTTPPLPQGDDSGLRQAAAPQSEEDADSDEEMVNVDKQSPTDMDKEDTDDEKELEEFTNAGEKEEGMSDETPSPAPPDENEIDGDQPPSWEMEPPVPVTAENEDDSGGGEDEHDEHENEVKKGQISPADAMVIFHKLLTMSGANVKPPPGALIEGGADSEGDDGDSEALNEEKKDQLTNLNSSMRPTTTPSRILNGRQVCNLPDHPVHAGCTSVVVVMINRTLYVANAGDSRAVLCRAGGIAEPLSFDHKPSQERESERIEKAGGFVNQFGRVNGNLNLSRSIGDLKYKQTAGLPPKDQMITAEPDVVQATLEKDDEFIVIGCDGIWDCLTNEQAVDYVRTRIDSKPVTEIAIEMLDDIISKDPRQSQGIGGDNMTCLIVDLLPKTRSYRGSQHEQVEQAMAKIEDVDLGALEEGVKTIEENSDKDKVLEEYGKVKNVDTASAEAPPLTSAL